MQRVLPILGGAIVVGLIAGGIGYLAGSGGRLGPPAKGTAAEGSEWTPPSAQLATLATYGSWEIKCPKEVTTVSGKRCAAMLQVVQKERNQILLTWSMGLDQQGRLTTLIQTPTGVLLQKGLDLKLGDAASRHIAFSMCSAQGCTAAGRVDPAFARDAAASSRATITVYTPDGRNLEFGIPIAGIDKALAALKP